MNLLAHLVLASASLPDTNGQEQTASMMADYYPGTKIEQFPKALQKGLNHHHAIDSFTDHNEIFKQYRRTIASFNPPHLTSGILADIFWDNILASYWDKYAFPLFNKNLKDFCDNAYITIRKAEEWHSPGFSSAFNFMYANSWLSAYATVNGIKNTLQEVSKTMRGKPPLSEYVFILENNKKIIESKFAEFWPQVLSFSNKWAADN